MFLQHTYFLLVAGISVSQVVTSQDGARAKYQSVKDTTEEAKSAATPTTTEGDASPLAPSIKGGASQPVASVKGGATPLAPSIKGGASQSTPSMKRSATIDDVEPPRKTIFPTGMLNNTWYVSDDGSDDNDCHSESAPCRNLQTVLDRAQDGADIYVTSPTLSLDAIHNNTTVYLEYHDYDYAHYKTYACCHVTGSKSYSISSMDGSVVNVTCSEHCILWTQQDKLDINTENSSGITLSNFLFDHTLVFHLYGAATFEHCFVYGEPFVIYLHKSWTEAITPVENISFYSLTHYLKFFGTKFEMESPGWDHRIYIRKEDCVRGIIIRNCTFLKTSDWRFLNYIYFIIGDKTLSNKTIATFVLIEDCLFRRFSVKFHVIPRTCGFSLLLAEMNNVVFYDSLAYKDIDGGLAAFVVHNCSFIGSESRPRALHVMDVLYVSVSNCIFQTYNLRCWQGCALSVKGVRSYLHKINTFSKAFPFNVSRPTLVITESQFVGSTALISGGSVSCVDAYLNVSNTIFQMTANSKPPPIGGFIYHGITAAVHKDHFLVENIILDVKNYVNPESLVMLSGKGNIKSFSLFCPESFQPKIMSKLYATFISCENSCPEGYAFRVGNKTFDMKVKKFNERVVIIDRMDCFPCPVGAVCNGTVTALPNYWGYRDQIGIVTMIRCPDDYCCHDNETCTEFNSCHSERTGKLCGKCQKNLTESLFLPNCIQTKNCHENLVLCLYTLGALIYTISLLFSDIVKNKIIQIFKKCLQVMKSRNKPVDKSMDSSEESPTTEHNKEKLESSDIKYIQILCYYVQDAALFKIHLPDDGNSGESIFVKVIQVSPDVLASFLTTATDICFKSHFPALTKVFFKSLFGPYVMVFIFLIFLIQKLLSNFFKRNSQSYSTLKSLLVKAFLMALLLSFQQIVTGAFTLVQCVDIGGSGVLYIQADIECYTWWQVVTQVFIFGNIIPILFVLSITPYFVKNNTMSVGLFILASIFPIPSLIYFIIMRWKIGRKVKVIDEERIFRDKDLVVTDTVSEKPYCGPDNIEIPFIDEISISDDQSQNVEQIKVNEIFIDQQRCKDRNSDVTESSHETGDNVRNIEAVLHTLLEHYKLLGICGVKFTWLGVHKLYRVALIACNTYITEHLLRLWIMISVLTIILVLSIFVKPYKESKANATAILSYVANLCIAIINVVKTTLATFGCQTNCSVKKTLLWYFSLAENILLIYLPIAAFVCWILSKSLKKCKCKPKNE